MTEDISPNVKILDSNYLSSSIIEPTQNIALFVGEFEKGNINEPKLISSELEFKQHFGRALEFNFNDWYQVYNYLKYPGSPKIWVCRTAGKTNIKASNNGNIANSPGVWGNLLTVEIYHKNNYNNYLKDIFGFYSHLEATEEYLVIIRRKDQIVENFMLSYARDLNSNYIEQIHLEEGIFELYDGYSEIATTIDYEETLNIFTKEDYEIDIVIASEDYNSVVIDYVENRKDCVGFLGIPRRFIDFIMVNGVNLATESGLIIILSMSELKYKIKSVDFEMIKDYLNTLTTSSRCILTLGFKTQFDGFTNNKKIINCIGDIAGLKAAASSRTPWGIGAGIEKGTLKNYEEIKSKVNPSEQLELYELGVNVLVNGTLMSQKLFVNEEESTNRLHQRNILNYLERATEKLVRKYIFADNTRQTRATVATEIKKLLEDMLSSGGIEAGKVHVTSNQYQKIIINIYVKLPYMAEFIKIGLANTGTNSVSFINEIIKEL